MMIKVWFSILALSLSYCYFIASNLPKGTFRLLSLLPIISVFTILPLYLSSPFLTGLSGLVLTWLANFKLLLFAFDQGPFSPSNDPPKSFLHFIFITCLPIKIKQNNNHPSPDKPKSPSRLALMYPTKVVLLAALVCLLDYKRNLHPKIVLCIYCLNLYLLLDVAFGLCNFAVRALLGIELESPSDEPYFSSSLQDFWGRRWNLMVTNALRHAVYKPVRSYVGKALPRRWDPLAPMMGLMAAFLVSGLMHELIFYYVTRVTPTWEVTWFFVLHGACLVGELGLKRRLTGKFRLHRTVSGPLTVGFVAATAMWLFFPPVVRPGTDVRVIEECKIFTEFVKSKSKLVFGEF
ncbi:hypothetical protein JRO89_XS15G0112800 [Xanthoceras sorbifolium]|uniref:Wax synthase domain-containing protein n=1 Tax=Xanthoceras sorbifolium TaxID=99658 RepID=A0ABQ8H1P0_9ROSI|nr:hypothetical protein JRO89_XS15G0112800 [Xanthoceras sorbifolium]